MQCLILAGGLGTRMRTVMDTPKALLPVGKKTFISIQLEWLKILGVTKVILALGHEGKLIEEHVKEKKSSAFPDVKFSYDGPTLLGTGGAIRNAESLLADEFIVTYGDSFLLMNIRDFEKTHKKFKKPVTLSIFKNRDQGDVSNVVFKDGKLVYDKVNRTREMEFIDYGMSIVKKDYFLRNTGAGKFDFAEFLTDASKKNDVAGFVAKEMFHEIGSPEGYQRFLKMMEQYDFDLKRLSQN